MRRARRSFEARRAAFCAACFFCLASSPGALAHPYHVTTAQAEHNRESGTLEVALKVLPEDLERALSEAAGEKIRLELSPDVDEQILAYLRAKFLLWKGEETLELRWVGKEVSVRAAWLYFEVPLPASLADLEVEQRMFFELEADQLNVVDVRDGETRYTLSLHREKPRASLRPRG